MPNTHTPDLRAVRNLYVYIQRGYKDYIERTPWKRAPMTFEEHLHEPETAEQQAYWEGFNAAMMDRTAPVFRAARNS